MYDSSKNKSTLMVSFWNNKILHVTLLVLVSSIVLFPNISNNPVYSWDEARHAVNALEIVNSEDWVTLTYNNEPDYANLKFPLGAWLIAINYKLFGVNEFSLRLWSVIFTILTTILLYFFGSLIKNRWLGILAAIVFISSMLVVTKHAGTTGDYDAGASFFLTLSLFLFLLFYKKGNRSFLFLSMASIGLGVMYKSFIPGLLPLLVIFIFLLLSKTERPLLNTKDLFHSALIIVAIIAPWLIARSMVGDSFITKLLSTDYWNRLTTAVDDHGEPFWFYLVQFKDGFYPWLYSLIPGLFLLAGVKREDKSFLLIWFFSVFLIFSVATTKNYWYILPVFPAMALIVSSFWLMLFEKISKTKFRKTLLVSLTGFLLLNIGLAFLNTQYVLSRNQYRNDSVSVLIDQEPVRKEIESLDTLLIGSNLSTQSNLFYLKRLVDNRFVFSSKLYCILHDKQRMLLKADANLIRKFLENCPDRAVSERYEDYVLIK